MEDARRSIFRAVRGAGVPVSPRQISLMTGVSGQDVRSLLRRMVRELAVKRVGHGRYAAMLLS